MNAEIRKDRMLWALVAVLIVGFAALGGALAAEASDADEPTKSLSPGKTVKISYPGGALYAVWSEKKAASSVAPSQGNGIRTASPTLESSAETVNTDSPRNVGTASMEDADEAQGGGPVSTAAIALVATALISLLGALVLVMGRRSR